MRGGYRVTLADLIDIADGACMLDGLQCVFVDQPSEQADLRARAKRLHDIVERAAGRAELEKSMKVYAIEATGNYGSGIAIVAADSEKDAIALATPLSSGNWYVRYDKPDKVEILPCVCDGPARVLKCFEDGD